ncbi:MAG: AraC family transcriptional regulator [Sphingomonadaceae bacterium]|nr:AraC family transcriptional regulator [Sphingomonadaceae bacterium]
MKDVVRAAGIVGFRRLVADLGGDARAILARVGLEEALLADPDRYIPYPNVLLAFEEAARSLEVSDFGMRLAARQDMTFLGPLSLAIQSARSVRDGLDVAARNIHFHTPSMLIESLETAVPDMEFYRLSFLVRDLPPIPQATEHAVAHLSKVVRVLSDDRIHPSEIWFRHERIAEEEAYARHFGMVPKFGAKMDGVVLRSAEIRCGLPGTNQQMQAFVERFLIGAAPSPDLSFPEQVREVLKSLVRVQQPNLQDVARVLRLHPRTLQRRLNDADMRFEIIQDEVRRELVETLLSQPAVPLALVAQTAGFSDQPALNRACRRWFGVTPRAKRQGLTLA